MIITDQNPAGSFVRQEIFRTARYACFTGEATEWRIWRCLQKKPCMDCIPSPARYEILYLVRLLMPKKELSASRAVLRNHHGRLGLRTLINRVRIGNTRSIRFCMKYGGEHVRTGGDFFVYEYDFARRRQRLKALAGSLGLLGEFEQIQEDRCCMRF